MREYRLLMEGARLRYIDELEKIYRTAFLTQVAKNKKRQGENLIPRYATFDDFFDKTLLEKGISKNVQKMDAKERTFMELVKGI